MFDELSVKTEGFVIQDLVDFVTKTIFESIKRDGKFVMYEFLVLTSGYSLVSTWGRYIH